MRHLREKDYQELMECLREALKTAKMEDCNFDSIGSHEDDSAPQKPGESVTSFIKRRTRLWRGSWLTGPLERAESILVEQTRRD